MNKIFFQLMIALLVLTGCSIKSRVIPFGSNTYKINVTDDNGAFKEEKKAISQAQNYCKSLEKEFTLIGARSASSYNHYELIFRCHDKNDPELRRPTNIEKPKEEDSDTKIIIFPKL